MIPLADAYLTKDAFSSSTYRERGGNLPVLLQRIHTLLFRAYFTSPAEPITRLTEKLGFYLQHENPDEAPSSPGLLAWLWKRSPPSNTTATSEEVALARALHLHLKEISREIAIPSRPLLYRLTDPRISLRQVTACIGKVVQRGLPDLETREQVGACMGSIYWAFFERIQHEREVVASEAAHLATLNAARPFYQLWKGTQIRAQEEKVARLQAKIWRADKLLFRMWQDGYTGWQNIFEVHNPVATIRHVQEVIGIFERLLQAPFLEPQLKQTHEEARAREKALRAHLAAPEVIEAQEKEIPIARDAFLKAYQEIFPIQGSWSSEQFLDFEQATEELAVLEAHYRRESRSSILTEARRYSSDPSYPQSGGKWGFQETEGRLHALKEEIKQRREALAKAEEAGGRSLKQFPTLKRRYKELIRARGLLFEAQKALEPVAAPLLETQEEVAARVQRMRYLFNEHFVAQKERVRVLALRIIRDEASARGWFGWGWAKREDPSLLQRVLERQRDLLGHLERLDGELQTRGWPQPVLKALEEGGSGPAADLMSLVPLGSADEGVIGEWVEPQPPLEGRASPEFYTDEGALRVVEALDTAARAYQFLVPPPGTPRPSEERREEGAEETKHPAEAEGLRRRSTGRSVSEVFTLGGEEPFSAKPETGEGEEEPLVAGNGAPAAEEAGWLSGAVGGLSSRLFGLR